MFLFIFFLKYLPLDLTQGWSVPKNLKRQVQEQEGEVELGTIVGPKAGAGAGAGTEPAGIFKLGREEAPGSSITQRIFPK